MTLTDLLRETLDVDCEDVWENERTPTPVRVFGVRLHSMGLSLREVVAVLELLGVDSIELSMISETVWRATRESRAVLGSGQVQTRFGFWTRSPAKIPEIEKQTSR